MALGMQAPLALSARPSARAFPGCAKRLRGYVISRRARVCRPKAEEGGGDDVDAATRKYGLEVGLWKALTSGPTTSTRSRGDMAKELLKVGLRAPLSLL